MNLSKLIAGASRLQRERGFKVAASAIIGLLVIGAFAAYAVLVGSGRISGGLETQFDPEFLQSAAGRTVESVLSNDGGITGAAVGAVLALSVWLGVIWLGLGLTYLALNAVGIAAGAVAFAFDSSGNLTRLIIGATLLAQAFAVGLQGLRALLGGHGPVTAVARNAINEAVRMKISLVFIVLLVVALATLPAWLDHEKPLRYRVQTFMSWGTGISFWLLALLTLLFGAATVTFEQRDKIIWQTMTKPVAAWQYVLGKWLGLASLNLVLLVICSGGVFLFVEYLRGTPADGERAAYVATGDRAITEDRLLLESEVLAARRNTGIEYPDVLTPGTEAFLSEIRAALEQEEQARPGSLSTAAERSQFAQEYMKNLAEGFRSVPPGGYREFRVGGLGSALENGLPLTLRVKPDGAGNRPDVFYRITLWFAGADPLVREMPLGNYQNIPISAGVVNPEDGTATLRIYNGRLFQTQGGGLGIEPNPASIRFPDDGILIAYPVGSYHANYLRAIAALWIKLSLLAMIAVCAGTFLSFPVACIGSLSAFLLAEMSGWLGDASDIYGYRGYQDQLLWYKVITTPIAQGISWVFAVYDGLNPIDRIVGGEYIAWGDIGAGVAILTFMILALFGIAVMVFSRRELATYSGQ